MGTAFDSEYDAFCEYARRHPDDCTLVVDTYDTIRSGIPNAIKAFDDVLAPLGKRPKSVRIDSGDITYLSKESENARRCRLSGLRHHGVKFA